MFQLCPESLTAKLANLAIPCALRDRQTFQKQYIVIINPKGNKGINSLDAKNRTLTHKLVLVTETTIKKKKKKQAHDFHSGDGC